MLNIQALAGGETTRHSVSGQFRVENSTTQQMPMDMTLFFERFAKKAGLLGLQLEMYMVAFFYERRFLKQK